MKKNVIGVSIEDIKTEVLLEELSRRMEEKELEATGDIGAIISQKIIHNTDGENHEIRIMRKHVKAIDAVDDHPDGKILYLLQVDDYDTLYNWIHSLVARITAQNEDVEDFEEYTHDITADIIDDQFTPYDPHERFDIDEEEEDDDADGEDAKSEDYQYAVDPEFVRRHLKAVSLRDLRKK